MQDLFYKISLTNVLIILCCGSCMILCALRGDSTTAAHLGTGLIGFLSGTAVTSRTGKEPAHEEGN